MWCQLTARKWWGYQQMTWDYLQVLILVLMLGSELLLPLGKLLLLLFSFFFFYYSITSLSYLWINRGFATKLALMDFKYWRTGNFSPFSHLFVFRSFFFLYLTFFIRFHIFFFRMSYVNFYWPMVCNILTLHRMLRCRHGLRCRQPFSVYMCVFLLTFIR